MAFELLESEKIIEVKRRHWFKLFESLSALALATLIVLSVPFVLGVYFPDTVKLYGGEIFLITGLFLQILSISFFLIALDYFLDMWVVTDRRLILIELKGLFSRETSSINYSNIQDVSVTVSGIVPTLLNYGDLQIQTAGEFKKFIFKDVPKPYELKDKILELHEQNRRT
ncbi:MAG: PH domain-containing protein [Candidatus Liptonbacteria bacterium]|nr:PH domain-containing protein [Candidatus Liptonbacteria bacterium]